MTRNQGGCEIPNCPNKKAVLHSVCPVHHVIRPECNCKPLFKLFRFPFKASIYLTGWISAVNRSPTWKPNRYSYICSEHFTEQEPNQKCPVPVLKLKLPRITGKKIKFCPSVAVSGGSSNQPCACSTRSASVTRNTKKLAKDKARTGKKKEKQAESLEKRGKGQKEQDGGKDKSRATDDHTYCKASTSISNDAASSSSQNNLRKIHETISRNNPAASSSSPGEVSLESVKVSDSDTLDPLWILKCESGDIDEADTDSPPPHIFEPIVQIHETFENDESIESDPTHYKTDADPMAQEIFEIEEVVKTNSAQ